MTATQVFFRFAKENGCYDIMRKCVLEAYIHIKHLKKQAAYYNDAVKGNLAKPQFYKYDSLIKMHGYKSFAVDILLKEMRHCLFNLIYIIDANSNTFQKGRYFKNINEKWSKYIRENLNGNYFKTMIPDEMKEFEISHDGWGRYKYRNGYHAINYTLRENKNDSCY